MGFLTYALFSLLTLIWILVKISKPDHSITSRVQIGLLIALFCIFGVMLYRKWPLTPWGRAAALRTVNEFMMSLSQGDHSAAVEKLTHRAQTHTHIVNSLKNPDTHPAYWELTTIDGEGYVTITGIATFPEKVNLPVRFKLKWRNGWHINAVTFGEREGDLRIDFLVSGW